MSIAWDEGNENLCYITWNRFGRRFLVGAAVVSLVFCLSSCPTKLGRATTMSWSYTDKKGEWQVPKLSYQIEEGWAQSWEIISVTVRPDRPTALLRNEIMDLSNVRICLYQSEDAHTFYVSSLGNLHQLIEGPAELKEVTGLFKDEFIYKLGSITYEGIFFAEVHEPGNLQNRYSLQTLANSNSGTC